VDAESGERGAEYFHLTLGIGEHQGEDVAQGDGNRRPEMSGRLIGAATITRNSS